MQKRRKLRGEWVTFTAPCAVWEVVRSDFEAAADFLDVWDLGVIFSVSFGRHGE